MEVIQMETVHIVPWMLFLSLFSTAWESGEGSQQ